MLIFARCSVAPRGEFCMPDDEQRSQAPQRRRFWPKSRQESSQRNFILRILTYTRRLLRWLKLAPADYSTQIL